MYYDIFGNSEYFRPESKLRINSFKEIFIHPAVLENDARKEQPMLNNLSEKLHFLELTTSDFLRKFNEFASNQASLTDPAKHTSFLDTIVHFQFAMILVGMEHAKINSEINKLNKIISEALEIPEKVDEKRIDGEIYFYSCKNYETHLYNDLEKELKEKKLKEKELKEKELKEKDSIFAGEFIDLLKLRYKEKYENLKSFAIQDLDKKYKKKWRQSTKDIKSINAVAKGNLSELKPIKEKLESCLNALKTKDLQKINVHSVHAISIEAKRILDTFDSITNGVTLKKALLFGVPNLSLNTVDYPGYIDFIFEIMFYHINRNQFPDIKLNSVDLTTPHTETIFLTAEIEGKLLELQKPSIKRKSFPEKHPKILFAYILNLLLFTLLFKDSQRSSLLGLDTKTWNAQLRLICPYLPVYFDNIQQGAENFDKVQNLKSYFKLYWAEDYFNNGISPISLNRQLLQDDLIDDDNWDSVSDDGTEA